MKSLGRIAYEAYEEFNEDSPAHYVNWMFINQAAKDAWEFAAQAVIEEYEQRKPDEGDDKQTSMI